MFDSPDSRVQINVCPFTPLSTLHIPVLVFKEKILDQSLTCHDYDIRDGAWLLESIQTHCSF